MSSSPLLFSSATEKALPRVAVVAELGVNHDGDPARAVRMVQAAAAAGADAVKVQLFHPDRLLSRQAALADYQTGQADDARDLLAKLTLSVAQLGTVREAARRERVRFIVTPFSPDDVADAATLDPDAVKIASPDAVNPLLIRMAATLGVPMLISTGTCELDELAPAADAIRRHAAGGAMLQCVSAYPTPIESAAIGGIAKLAERFDLPVGYSDHTVDSHVGALAVAAGAVVLEKHLTHDPSALGPDHAASLDPAAFADYVRHVRQAAAALGPTAKRVLPIEASVREVSRQSVCVTADLSAGHVLTDADLTVKRPGVGIAASRFDSMLGRRLARAVERGALLAEADVGG